MNFIYKTKSIFKTMLTMLLIMLMVSGSLLSTTIDASAHNAYFLGITFDPDSCRYIGTVVYEENSVIGGNHAEAEISTEFYKLIKDNSSDYETPFDINYGSDDSDEIIDAWDKYDKTNFDNDKELLFTFPGFHTKGVATDKLNADGADERLASRVCNTLIPQLNSAITWILQVTGKERTADNARDVANDISERVVTSNTHVKNNSGEGSKSKTYGSYTVNFKTDLSNSDLPDDIKDSIPQGFSKKDYVKITITKGGNVVGENYFIYQCWKGYKYENYDDDENPSPSDANDNDPLARDVSRGDWYKDVCKDNSVYKIGWNAIVLQAHFNFDMKAVGFSNMGEILPTNALIDAVASLCDWAFTGIRSFLGLYEIDDLMLNNGNRNSVYSMGLFPNSWVGPIMILHIACQMVAWAIMGFAVIKMLMKRQLATINVGEKMNMMNELKNIAICGFLLGSFPLVFNMLARINHSLVDFFGSTSSLPVMLSNFSTVSQASLGSILVGFVTLALTIYFNFFYILRGITLAILYGIAPLCIYSLALGGKFSKVFGAWMKELLSNIFVQTIHSAMAAFFTSVIGVNGISPFEMCVVLYSFIPLTKFIKQNVFQAGDAVGGMAGGLAGGLATAASSVASGPKGGNSGGNSSSGGGNSGGGGGGNNSRGGSNASTGIMADRMANMKSPSQEMRGNNLRDDAQLQMRNSNQVDRAGRRDSAYERRESEGGFGNDMLNSMSARGRKERHDAHEGFSSSNHPDTQMTSLDGSQMGNPNLKSREVARARGMVQGSAHQIAGNTARGLGRAALQTAGGVAMGAFALGVSSFDDRAGAKFMGQATESLAQSRQSAYHAVRDNIGGDRDVRRQLRNHGVAALRDDGKNVYKTYDDITYNTEEHRLTGAGLNRLSESERNTLNNIARAQDRGSGMSDEERAHYNTFAARNGIQLGTVNRAHRDGSSDTSLVMGIDKNIAAANGRQNDYVSYGHAAPTYTPRPRPVRGGGDPSGGGPEPSGGGDPDGGGPTPPMPPTPPSGGSDDGGGDPPISPTPTPIPMPSGGGPMPTPTPSGDDSPIPAPGPVGGGPTPTPIPSGSSDPSGSDGVPTPTSTPGDDTPPPTGGRQPMPSKPSPNNQFDNSEFDDKRKSPTQPNQNQGYEPDPTDGLVDEDGSANGRNQWGSNEDIMKFFQQEEMMKNK